MICRRRPDHFVPMSARLGPRVGSTSAGAPGRGRPSSPARRTAGGRRGRAFRGPCGPAGRAPGRSASAGRSCRTRRRAAPATEGWRRPTRSVRASRRGRPSACPAGRPADCGPSGRSTRGSCGRRGAWPGPASASGPRPRSDGSGHSRTLDHLAAPLLNEPAGQRLLGLGHVGEEAGLITLGAKVSLCQRRWIRALPAGASYSTRIGCGPGSSGTAACGSPGGAGNTWRPSTQIRAGPWHRPRTRTCRRRATAPAPPKSP